MSLDPVPTALKAVLFASAFLAVTAHASTDSYFASDLNLADVARDEFGAARFRADAMLSELDDSKDQVLVDQLVGLADAKKVVRVIAASGRDLCRACDRLELHGADVRRIDTRLLHRVVILDGPRGVKASGILGNVLISEGSLQNRSKDASLVVLANESALTLAYQDQFNFLWALAKDHDDSARSAQIFPVKAPAAAPIAFSSGNMMAFRDATTQVLSPALDLRDTKDGVVSAYLAGAIDVAADQVLVNAPALKSIVIYQALARAIERGVAVRILLAQDQQQNAANLPNCAALPRASYRFMDECLAALGADVRYAAAKRGPSSAYLLVDSNRLLAGNFRLSRTSEMKSLGAVFALTGTPAKSFISHFEKMFAKAQAQGQRNMMKSLTKSDNARIEQAGLAELSGCVPIRHASLTFEEKRKWRAIYLNKMCE